MPETPEIIEASPATAANSEAVAQARANIARIVKLLFKRHLTDAAGGNVSVRVGDVVCITSRYSGSQRQWQIAPEDVLVADLDRHILDGKGQLSREANVHFTLHREFGSYGTAVIHAHARNVLVFSTAGRAMPPILEATRKFGIPPIVNFAPAHTVQLAENVAAAIRGREAIIKTQAAGVIAPWHGVFLIGKDLNAAFDAVERMDTNAYCLLMRGALPGGSDSLEAAHQRMEAEIAAFEEHKTP